MKLEMHGNQLISDHLWRKWLNVCLPSLAMVFKPLDAKEGKLFYFSKLHENFYFKPLSLQLHFVKEKIAQITLKIS